jgi:hypothetical protein
VGADEARGAGDEEGGHGLRGYPTRGTLPTSRPFR